jgi:hypothetical protein
MELYRQTVSYRVDVADASLAMAEMRTALATLIWHFDIKLREGQEVPVFRHLPVSVTPLEVCIVPVPRHRG